MAPPAGAASTALDWVAALPQAATASRAEPAKTERIMLVARFLSLILLTLPEPRQSQARKSGNSAESPYSGPTDSPVVRMSL